MIYCYGRPNMAEQEQDDQQLGEGTECNREDVPEAMNDWEK